MSYILNALRKSERERQAMQPDTAIGRIAVRETPERQSPAKIIIVLVLLNLAILTYFLGIAPRPAENKVPPAANNEESAPSVAKAAPPLELDALPEPAKIAPAPKIEQSRNLAPIAEKPVTNPKQTVEPVQRIKPTVTPVQPLKPLPAAIAKPAPANKPTTLPEPASNMASPRIVEPGELVAKKPEPVAIGAPKSTDMPTLQDLPADMRQALPSLPINVYSYSSTPAERFVMIDMVKYVPGQTIKNELELKEIMEDGIVVRYGGRVFKIKR